MKRPLPKRQDNAFRESTCLPTMHAANAEVANIEPIGSTPGLVAFLCVDCGLTDSILVYSVNRGGKVNHTQHAEHR